MVSNTVAQQVEKLQQQYSVMLVNLAHWTDNYEQSQQWLTNTLKSLRKESYNTNERIVFTATKDYFVADDTTGLILKNLQVLLNEVDISNFFVIVLSTDSELNNQIQSLLELSQDQTPITGIVCQGDFEKIKLDRHPQTYKEIYQYGSINPIKIRLSDLSQRENFLLADSRVFCMYPWIHLHAYPTGDAYPCCQAEMSAGPVGTCRETEIKDLINSDRMKRLRLDMLNETENPYCTRCYEQEQAGFFSGRRSANKHHGHNIKKVSNTQADGSLSSFEMTYWDIRFSNLCNLSCRSCGHIFSSSWYKDQTQLAGVQWAQQNSALNYAGRTETDIWEQLIPHLDYVEQIYFAGGEPLMMEEHYNILDELDRRGRYDVRLIYNTNFTHIKLKNRTVFDYWKRFDSVSVGASLDAMGPRAEYIRHGTSWDQIERNRELMLETCPDVDFYISPTLSIFNAWHLPEFHQDWTNRGLIRAQDLNVNVLQDPAHYRIDIAPLEYKNKIKQKFEEHLEWLRPQDQLQRATVGFESAINFMMSTDNTKLLESFWLKTQQLDQLRRENLLETIPELAYLK